MKIVFGIGTFICIIIFIYELSWLGKGSLAPILLALSGILALVCGYLARKEK